MVRMMEWTAERAEQYAEKYGEYATNRLAVEALTILPGSVVVDIGCGTGCALRTVASRVRPGVLIGIDPVPRMLEIARKRAEQHPEGHRIEFCEAPAAQLPIDDGTADWVFAFDSIDHWVDVRAGLVEVQRILTRRGRFVAVKDASIPDADAPQAFLGELEGAGLRMVDERALSDGDVSCTLWICART